jgi:diphosphomevalonate decarboxylase
MGITGKLQGGTISKMSKSTAMAHSNLAFVKYWGKKNTEINIPLNNSISMNLSAARTTTTVEFDDNLAADKVTLDGHTPTDKFSGKVSKHLDRLRQISSIDTYARVQTENNFPAATGFASSASGFAALTLATSSALGLDLDEKTLSILARQGSGSACRSIPGGFVEWYAGTSNEDSYAAQMASADHWDIADVAVVVASQEKDVSSSQGHLLAENSPFWPSRAELLPGRLDRVRRAIMERDFRTFGREIEAEAMSMHTIMMTSAHEVAGSWRSGVYYWAADTLELLIAVQRWRADGIPVYFTLDAGPTVHLMCPGEHRAQVMAAVEATQGQREWSILVSRPATGASIVTGPEE